MTIRNQLMVDLNVQKPYAKKPPKVYDKPHVPYSRAAGKSYAKQAKGFKEVVIHAGHPKRTFTEKKGVSPLTPVGEAIEKVKAAKHGARNAHNKARGRRLTIDAGVRKAKLELRVLRNGKRRK